ncbi:MAG: epoxyqueuosine reductase QueH [Oscillospiraceae bacterium]|nr:epoxyqueuosine reductase QueH [Oscillospiraceae bacterium]
MQQNVNYQRELDSLIKTLEKPPKLLLHCCCAPCSSYVLEYLSDFFEITCFFYNPNISPSEEYEKRAAELERLITAQYHKNPVSLIVEKYNPEEFYAAVKGLEKIKEGGERCFKCYRLRLEAAAKYAAEYNFDYFCSTLSISPLKNAQKLNEIGEELADIYKIPHLPNDFKKKGGYKRSVELSAEYDLYRQNYCGCVFSKQERGL